MEPTPCVATDDGRPCLRPVTLTHPARLCLPHQIEIAMATLPEVLRKSYAASLAEPSAPVQMELVETALPVPIEGLLSGVHEHVVYFIANGGRVKIGFTTNLKSRLSALSLRRDNVLMLLRGGPELERALHEHFSEYRSGNTEWFELAPEVFRYVADQSNYTEGERPPVSYDGVGSRLAVPTPEAATVPFGKLPKNHQALLQYMRSQGTDARVRQAARVMNVAPATIRRWRDDLEGKGYDMGVLYVGR